MVGTVNFFNIDNVAYGQGSAEQVMIEGQKCNTWVQGIVDHRSDHINVGGRVEKAFKDAYGRDEVRFVHTCSTERRRQSADEAGECSIVVMPELRSRAGKCIRDKRGWGRYAGIVIDGKREGPVQRRVAILTVYAPCGQSSAAAVRQAAGIAKAVAAGERGMGRKSPFAVLLKDLTAEIVELKRKGVAVIIGGDFNTRHDGAQRPWRQLRAWCQLNGLGDVLRTRRARCHLGGSLLLLSVAP